MTKKSVKDNLDYVIKEHYVPQVYLKQFTNDNGMVWIFDKKQSQLSENSNKKIDYFIKEKSPSSICYEKNIYEIIINGDYYQRNFYERQYASFENNLSPFLGYLTNKITKAKKYVKISKKEKEFISYTIANMITRNKLIMDKTIDWLVTDGKMKGILKQYNGLDAKNVYLISFMKDFEQNIYKYIVKNGKFLFYKCEDPMIVSDCPATFKLSPKGYPHFFFPLSSYTAVEIFNKRDKRRLKSGSIEKIKSENIIQYEEYSYLYDNKFLMCKNRDKLKLFIMSTRNRNKIDKQNQIPKTTYLPQLLQTQSHPITHRTVLNQQKIPKNQKNLRCKRRDEKVLHEV